MNMVVPSTEFFDPSIQFVGFLSHEFKKRTLFHFTGNEPLSLLRMKDKMIEQIG